MRQYLPFLRFLFFAIIAMILAWTGQPFVHGNEKAIDLIINVFAILAGFLIAIMTLFSDMRFDEDANWRKIQIEENRQEQRYTKHSTLFYTYLAVLITVFLVILLAHQEAYKNSAWVIWLERFYLFLSCISIIYSVFLPNNLMKRHKEEFKKLMEKKQPKS